MDTRFPYTYACDLLRTVNPNISRSEASQIRGIIAKVLGMEDKELAEKLAIFHQGMENKSYVFKGNEIIPVLPNYIGFKITNIDEMKVATWLEPKNQNTDECKQAMMKE